MLNGTNIFSTTQRSTCIHTFSAAQFKAETRMWPMPNVMAALPNIGGALCSTPQFG